MRLVSIDVETSGLNPERHQILEFGAVLWDTHSSARVDEMPVFRRLMFHDEIIGEPVALAMHAKNGLLNELAEGLGNNVVREGNLFLQFFRWLQQNGYAPETGNGRIRIVAIGKNFANFDSKFLVRCNSWGKWIELHHRSLDPGALFFDPVTDYEPPSLATCLERAGEPAIIAHRVLDDARNVIRAMQAGLRRAQ